MTESPLFGRGMGEASYFMIYRFRRDKNVKAMSVLCMAALAAAPIGVAVDVGVCTLEFAVVSAVVLFVLYLGLRTPRYVYIDPEVIVVKYHIGRKVLADIESVRCVTREELRGATRLYGNSGFMAYSGWFRSAGLGKFYMDAVNKDELALVTLANGRKYVINYPRELLKKKNDKIVSC